MSFFKKLNPLNVLDPTIEAPKPYAHPGTTVFEKEVKRSFAAVNIDSHKDNAIDSSQFLEACESFETVMARIGAPIGDVPSNIQKTKTRFLSNPLQHETLQLLVKSELIQNKHDTASSVLWLFGGLDFMVRSLQNAIKTEDPLDRCFASGYDSSSLSKLQHSLTGGSFLSSKTRGFGIKFGEEVKTRGVLYAALGDDPAKVQSELETWLDGLERLVGVMVEFQRRKETQWSGKPQI